MNFMLDGFQLNLFPLLDLFPWVDTVNTRKAALSQLYEYLSSTKPLVATGLGKHSSSALFSNLLHHHGCGHRPEGFSYIKQVALPRLCHFVDDEWVETSDMGRILYYCNVDPGYERYGERSIDLLELMDITYK